MPDPSRHNKVIQNEHAEQTRKINEERNKPKNPFEDIVREIGETVGSAVAEAAHEVYIPVHHKDEKQEQPQPELPKLDPTTVPNFTTLTDKASAVEAYHAFNFKFAGDLQKGSVTTPGKTREERTKERLDKNIKDMWEDAEKRKADREHRAGNYFFNNAPLGYMLSADAAAKNLVNNGEINPDAERNLKVIQDIFQGKYSFGVTSEEFEEWQKKAYKKTGNYLMNPDGSFQLDPFGNKIPETVLRSDAPPPPIGTDAANYDRWMKKNTYLTQEWDEKKGKWKDVRYLNPDADDVPVQASEFKKYWDWYMQYNKDLDIEHKMAEEKKHYMAGVDPDATDSLLDVVRDGFSGKQDIFTGAYKYFDNYVFNPLKQGDWGTLGMNTLVNLGETMDLFGVGLRAVVGAQDTLKYDGRHIIKGQNEFVYSSGKKKQKELMEHGAGDLIRYREGLGGKYSVDAKAAEIKAELQKAGLWDEYLKLEAEWNLHDNKGSIPENLKAAYTTHENFEGDTGSTLKNLVVETLLDPSLLVGGSAKIASSAGSKAVAKGALKAAIEGVDDLATKEFVDFINVGKGAVKTYMREVGEGIVMKNPSTIQKAIENFAERAVKENVLIPDHKDIFISSVKEAIGDVEHNAEYRFIQSLSNVDRMVDRIDSILLKSSFIVPYAPFKTISMTRKILRNTEWYANSRGMRKGQRELQAMRDLFEGLVQEDNRVSIGNFREVLKRMNDNAVLRGDDKVRSTVVGKLTKDMSDHLSMMKRASDQLANGSYTPDEFEELLNAYIHKVSSGKINSIDDFKDYIDNIFNEGADRFKGSLDEMKRTFDDLINSIERSKEIAVENFKIKFYRELKSAPTFEDVQKLAYEYKRWANAVDSSFEESLVLRANELFEGAVKEVDDILRDFEYKNATSVYEPSAVIDDILKGIEKDKTSKYLNKLHPDVEKDVKDFVDYLEENFDLLSEIDKQKFSDILFGEDGKVSLKDVNPRELRTKLIEVIRDNELRIVSEKYNPKVTKEGVIEDSASIDDNYRYSSAWYLDELDNTEEITRVLNSPWYRHPDTLHQLNAERIVYLDNELEGSLSDPAVKAKSLKGLASTALPYSLGMFFGSYSPFYHKMSDEFVLSLESDITDYVDSLLGYYSDQWRSNLLNEDRLLLAKERRASWEDRVENIRLKLLDYLDSSGLKESTFGSKSASFDDIKQAKVAAPVEGVSQEDLKWASEINASNNSTGLEDMYKKGGPGSFWAYERLHGQRAHFAGTDELLDLSKPLPENGVRDLRFLARSGLPYRYGLLIDKYPDSFSDDFIIGLRSDFAELRSLYDIAFAYKADYGHLDDALTKSLQEQFYKAYDRSIEIIEDIRNRMADEIEKHPLKPKQYDEVIEEKVGKVSEHVRRAVSDFDYDFIKQCRGLVKVLDDIQLNIKFSDDMELLDLHCDIFNIFNKYISDSRFTDVRNSLETNGVIEKLNRAINVVGSFTESQELAELKNKLQAQVEILRAYDNLTIELRKIPGLSDNQYWTVLDSIFGFTKNNPDNFFIKASRDPERLIEKINLNMDTLFGKSKVSLDGFRYEARNYSSELWDDYADEIVDSDIQQRVENILSGGHLNPDKDVQTQMLQLILRDKGSIDYYNELAKEQAVLFTDIETEGLNSGAYAITDISYSRWQPDVITSDSSLKEILDFIEGSETNRYTSRKLNSDIRSSMTTSTLEGLFKDSPNAGREEMLEEYCRIYGTDNPTEVISEADMLREFVTGLDEVFDEFDGKTPILVTHSNRGFDKKFIRDRIVHYKQENIDVTPSHIVHLQDLVDASESTVERLKGLTDDIILTSAQSSMIEDIIVKFARSISSYTDNMKILDIDVFEDFFAFENQIKSIKPAVDSKAQQIFKELEDYFGSQEFLQLKANYQQLAREIHSDTRRFNGTMLYEASRGKSIFEKAFDAGDSVIPEVGYNIAGSVRGERSAGKYFGVLPSQNVNVDVITSMTGFTREVDSILRYQLRQNSLLAEYEDEFRKVIRYTKEYAADLSEADPFYYFKYLEEPDTPYEAFAMAQIIWDKTLKFVKEDTLEKSVKTYKGLNAISSNVRDYVLSFVMSGKKYDLTNSVSMEALDILKGVRSQDIIYKHGISELYYPKITKPLETSKDFVEMQSRCEQSYKSYNSYTNIVEGFVDEAEDYAVRTAHETMIEIGEDVKRMEQSALKYADDGSLETFYVIPTFVEMLKRQFNGRRKMMTAQILDHVTESEDNLIGHLLFHNHQLHVPVKGNTVHVNQVTALRTLLVSLEESSPIVFKEHNGFIHIGLKKDTNIRIINDSRYADEKATQMIDGRDIVYTAPEYKVIDNNLPTDDMFKLWIGQYFDRLGLVESVRKKAEKKVGFYLKDYKRIMMKMRDVYDQIDFLTEGKSVGSVGTLHTLSRQKQIFKNLPKDFLDEILTEETTCDARFWHQASFDMTCLGDSDNMWKYTDYNDADPLLSLYNTLNEVTGSASAERMYLGYWNHPDSPYRLDSMFNDVDDAEKINILNNMTDTVVVNFTAKDTAFFGGLKSKTGVEVNALEIKDLTDLRRAEASGAIVVPYELYLDMQEVFNKSEITDTISGKVMKAWTKCIWLYKVGQLSNPGTWVRNWIDATMKMTGETGDVGQTARCQLKAFHSLATYKTITKKIKKISDLNYTSVKDIEREYSKLPERYRNMMSYEEYKFIDDWLKVSIAGGESRTLKSIEDYSNSAVNLNAALKQGSTQGILTQRRLDELKQGYDLIGDKIQRFEELGEDEIKSLIYESNTWLWNDLSKGRFMQIFREGQDIATDEELFEYNKICNQLIEDRFKRIRGDRKVSNIINHTANYLLTPMSGVEEVVRLAQYMALEEQGYTRNQVFKSIVSSQFNYDNKSMRAKMLEMFIPYYGFMDANLSYWCKSLDKNPRMLRYVEHIWGELSWDAAMQFGEDPEQNQSVNYMMGHGGIPIGDSGTYLKTEPSFLQPINLMLGSPSEYMNTLATPFQFGIKALLGTGGSEYSALFHELSNGQGDVQNEFLNSLPIIGSAKTRYYDHFTAESPRWERLEDANFIERNLVKFNPSLFGAVKRYQTDKEDAYMSFQQSLAAQGKWWDQNLQRAVPISEMNTDGLNNPNLSFDERSELIFLYQNKLWDANKEQYVDVDNFEAGGLNREFNLDNPGEWDELCRLKEEILNKKWDYNKRKWVDADKFEEIMLNDPNCSWEDNQRYHDELFGEKYDYNQGKYVQKEQYIKGGLNDEYGSHTFSELCALQYALHGKEYIRGEGFVKTGEPIVQYDIPETDLDRTILYDRTDPVTKMLARLGLVEETYADTLPKLSTTKKGIEGRWVLNGNPAHDSKIFEEIMDVYADKAPTFDNSTRFHNWTGTTWRKYNSGWREFADLPELPKAARYAMKPQKKVKFGYSYTSGGEYAALRTALYGTQVYEDYYRFEFSYNYNYRSPSAGPKKYAGSLYRAGQYRLRGGQNRIKDKWRYYTR